MFVVYVRLCGQHAFRCIRIRFPSDQPQFMHTSCYQMAALSWITPFFLQSLQPKTLAVGCHDLGQFIQYHPQGRYIVAGMHGKELVMNLMAHPDPEVQKQALLCVQRIMLSKTSMDFLR